MLSLPLYEKESSWNGQSILAAIVLFLFFFSVLLCL